MEFNLKRLANLMRMDFIIHKKSLALLIGVLLVVCAIIFFLAHDGAPDDNPNVPADAAEIVFSVLLLICGSFFTATIFKEFRQAQTRLQYLTVPASNFEKIFSKWIYTFPFYLLLVVIIMILGHILFVPVIEYFMEVKFVPMFELRFQYFGYNILGYFIANSAILFLGTLFNRFPIPKIVITAALVALLSVLVGGTLFRVIFFNHFDGLFYPNEYMKTVEISQGFKDWVESFLPKIPYLIAFIAIPYLWVISYFKMKEKQV